MQAALIQYKYNIYTQYIYNTNSSNIAPEIWEDVLRKASHPFCTEKASDWLPTSGSACPPLTTGLRIFTSVILGSLSGPRHSCCMTRLSMGSCREATLRPPPWTVPNNLLTEELCTEDILKRKVKSCLNGMRSNSWRGDNRTLQPFCLLAQGNLSQPQLSS